MYKKCRQPRLLTGWNRRNSRSIHSSDFLIGLRLQKSTQHAMTLSLCAGTRFTESPSRSASCRPKPIINLRHKEGRSLLWTRGRTSTASPLLLFASRIRMPQLGNKQRVCPHLPFASWLDRRAIIGRPYPSSCPNVHRRSSRTEKSELLHLSAAGLRNSFEHKLQRYSRSNLWHDCA